MPPEGDRLLPRAWTRRERHGREAHVTRRVGEGVQLLLVDNDDCFIHTLANYARQTGAEVCRPIAPDSRSK